MIGFKTYPTREAWLEARRDTIGGSDSASVLALNPWKSNTELWELLTRSKEPEDISDNPLVKYGIEAEAPLRELFKLDYPEYKVLYAENNMFLNPHYPFGHYSADGWLIDNKGRWGIWECKTTTIQNKRQLDKWAYGKVPDNYFVQLLHGMLITEADYAVLKAQLKYSYKPDIEIRHYFFERAIYEDAIERLRQEEEEFYEYVKTKKRPPLKLNDF